MNGLVIVRPAPGWDKLRFDLSTGEIDLPADTPVGITAFGEGTWVLNRSDRAAVDAAMSLGTTDAGWTLTALALETTQTDAAETAVREALARGADRGVLLTGEDIARSDSYSAATAIADAVARLADELEIGVIFIGGAAPSGAPDEIGPMLAEALGWAQITGALSVEPAPGAEQAIRVRQRWSGVTRVVEARLPAVISVLPDPRATPRYAHSAGALDAYREKQLFRWSAVDLGLKRDEVGWSAARAGVRRATLAENPPQEKLDGPLDESVAVLLLELKNRGLVGE